MNMAIVDSRYSFTAQNLCASAIFARRCEEIETDCGSAFPPEESFTAHRGLVVAAIMQSTAAVEAESSEITMHGPGHHLGSDRTDHAALKFLRPLTDVIDKQDSLNRFQLILHLLGKPSFDEGVNPFQAMATLVRARNELVHYKSKLGQEMEREKLFERLKQLKLAPPPFTQGKGHMNFFPHLFLSAATARWAVRTASAFLNEFYGRLGVPSILLAHAERLKDM
jgi:hypothetical protein